MQISFHLREHSHQRQQDQSEPDICGGTKINDCRFQCHSSQDLQGAQKICAAAGMRMCTKDELLDGAGGDAGDGEHHCGFDKHEVWSSTVCGSVTKNPSRYRVTLAKKAAQCRAMKNAHGYVRCCADLAAAAPHAASGQKKKEDKHRNAAFTIVVVLSSVALLIVVIVFVVARRRGPQRRKGIDALFELRDRQAAYSDDPEREGVGRPTTDLDPYKDEAPGQIDVGVAPSLAATLNGSDPQPQESDDGEEARNSHGDDEDVEVEVALR